MDRIKRIIISIGVALAVGLSLTTTAIAASPTAAFIVPAGVLRSGQTVSVDVHLDSGGLFVNAFNLVLRYSPVYLQPISITRQQNVWTLWPEEPHWDVGQGAITLTGGRPNGVVAIDAPVATMTFRILAGGQTQLVLDPASGLYLNDGRGTRVDLAAASVDLFLADALVPTLTLDPSTTPPPDTWSAQRSLRISWPADPSQQYSYTLATDSQTVPDDTPDQPVGLVDYPDRSDGVYYWTIKSRTDGGLWSRVSQFRFLLDTQPPHPFRIIIVDPSSIGGRRAIAWNTSDDTSGVAASTLLVEGRTIGPVTSPLVLRPEWLGRTLTIIVRDAAGNEQRAAVRYSRAGPFTGWPLVLVMMAAAAALTWWRIRRE